MKKVTDINKKREQRGEDFYCKEIESLVYEIGKISGKTADFTFQEMRNIPREKKKAVHRGSRKDKKRFKISSEKASLDKSLYKKGVITDDSRKCD